MRSRSLTLEATRLASAFPCFLKIPLSALFTSMEAAFLAEPASKEVGVGNEVGYVGRLLAGNMEHTFCKHRQLVAAWLQQGQQLLELRLTPIFRGVRGVHVLSFEAIAPCLQRGPSNPSGLRSLSRSLLPGSSPGSRGQDAKTACRSVFQMLSQKSLLQDEAVL